MKRFVKLVLALAITAPMVSFAASTSHHVSKPPTKALLQGTAGSVGVYNYTYDDYAVEAITEPTGTYFHDHLSAMMDNIPDGVIYELNYPDTEVCVTITRYFDHWQDRYCVPGGNDINIGLLYSTTNSKAATHAKPLVTIVKQH